MAQYRGSTWQEVLYAVRDRVATITLNRPDKLNVWTGVMSDELRAALATADADEAVRAIVITGAEGFAEAVQARAAEIANLSSPRSTRIIKRQVYEAMFQTLAEATAIANREQEECRDTEDFREGIAHFMEKRAPRFAGR